MKRITGFFRRNAFLAVAITFTFIALAPACRADSGAKAEKRAQKMERRLTKYRTGTLLEIDFRDNSQAVGNLGDLSDATFQITSSDTNKVQTFNYADVAHVKKTKEYIGAGSEPGHHVRLWVPIVVAAAAAGGGIAAYEALH